MNRLVIEKAFRRCPVYDPRNPGKGIQLVLYPPQGGWSWQIPGSDKFYEKCSHEEAAECIERAWGEFLSSKGYRLNSMDIPLDGMVSLCYKHSTTGCMVTSYGKELWEAMGMIVALIPESV